MRVEIHPEVGDPLIASNWRHSFHGWWVTSIEGWHGTPAPREGAISASGRDGDMWPSRLTQGKRVITIGFYAAFRSSVEAERLCSSLTGLYGQRLKVIIENAGGKKWAEGFLSGDLDVTLALSESEFSFSLTMTCPDPHRYGMPERFDSSSKTVTVLNLGNAPTWPKIIVPGHVKSLTAVFSGHTFKWTGDAQSLVLDLRKPSASSGTIDIDDAFSIPPGASDVSVTTDAGYYTFEICSAWR